MRDRPDPRPGRRPLRDRTTTCGRSSRPGFPARRSRSRRRSRPTSGRSTGSLLGGGVDVDPARYGSGAARERHRRGRSPSATPSTSACSSQARSARPPVLGICRGLQVVNVALGGTLVQDLPSERPSPCRFTSARGRRRRASTIASQFTPGTRAVADRRSARRAVNSRHHQAIESVAPALTVSAMAPDGVVEAVEAAGDPWLAGGAVASREPRRRRAVPEPVPRVRRVARETGSGAPGRPRP